MKKTILFLLLSVLLLLPVSADESRLEAGVYHASEIDYFYLLDAADGTQIAQFITTDGIGNETFSLTAEWNGMSGSLKKNGETITFTAEVQDDGAIYINQDIFLFEELSGFYVTAEKVLDITETTAMLLIEHIPAMTELLGENPQWELAPALVNNLFYSLTALRDGSPLAEFYVLRDGGAIFRMDGDTPQLLSGSLQNVLDKISAGVGEITLSTGVGLKAHQLNISLPEFLQSEAAYSSSARSIFRVNSRGLILPRKSGSAQVNLRISLGNESAEISIPVIIND